ncbi:carboxypeptidase-like regulatory domain-containing protein [uncultured Polaribacter sp.]|uniref:carboxypeptidase-like regulatory domain-containing protein n=1 Tax=uncultured Polaribacter sp. TaxID=174711 RepID=UPI0026276DB4|nr:carboxypeptidase-like regulatory domain-containing protein [uncultured Polaribacter sp.]
MKRFCWIVCFIFSVHLYSQNTITIDFVDEPLESVLKKLEEKFNLRFSYQDTIVENKSFSLISNNISLHIILNKLQQSTNLIFEKINHRYFIVKSKHQLEYNEICGNVFDKETLERLQYADIMNLNQGTGTSTNEKGYFKLSNVKKNDTIAIHFLGFESKKILAREFLKDKCKSLEINPSNEQLNEIILKEYLTKGISKNSDGSIKFSPKSLGILPGLTEPDVFESLQYLPGIQSPNETASGLHIRGGTPDQNLILWDGIKVYHSGHLFGMISAFNPYITDEVNVYKNGAKAKYGNRISGVIDANSEKKIPLKLSGGFGVNMTHADAYLKTPIFNKKVGIVTSFRRSFVDVVNTFTYKKLTKKVFQNSRIGSDENAYLLKSTGVNNKFYFTDYNIKVNMNLTKKDNLTFSSLYVKNRLDYSASFSNQQYNDTEEDLLKIRNVGFFGSWKKQWNEKISHNLSISNSTYDLNYTSKDTFDEVGTLAINKGNNIKETILDLETNIKLSDKHSLQAGYQHSTNKVSFSFENKISYIPENDYLITDKATNISSAFYSEYTYNNPKKFLFDVSMRLNSFSVTDEFFIEPRFNFKVFLNKNLKIGVSGEVKNQPITQIIEFVTSDLGLENQVWALADNVDFPSLNSRQISANVNYKKNNWNFDVEGYVRKTKGLTSFTRGFASATGVFSAGNSDNYGIDFLIKKRIRNYRTWIAYSFAHSNIYFDQIENAKKFRGNFDIRHSFNWAHSLKLGKFQLSLGWKYRTSKPFTELSLPQNGENSITTYTEVNGGKLPNYHRLDFSGTYEFQLSKLSQWKGKIGFSLLNMYDRRNILNKLYRVSQNDDDEFNLIESNQNGLRITPNIVFRVSF